MSSIIAKDWSVCALCARTTSEKLIDPLASKRPEQAGSGYSTLAENLKLLESVGALPLDIDTSTLDDGSGVESTLRMNNAKWHKSCSNRCSKLKYERALRKRKIEEDSETPERNVKTRSKVGLVPHQDKDVQCLFCDEKGDTLHKAATLGISKRVKAAAIQLQDEKLLAKLASGDMVANDAVYHGPCLTALYNRVRKDSKGSTINSVTLSPEAIALAELVQYMEENKHDSTFLLSEVTKLYSNRIKELGAKIPERINSTRLKERLQSALPGLKSCNIGKEVRLTFDENICAALQFAEKHYFATEAIHVARVASKIRQEILETQPQFNGSFDENCQNKAIPASLLALVEMLIEGSNITRENNYNRSQSSTALTISQLIIFNAISRKREPSVDQAVSCRHSIKRETPLPLYVGLVVHAETRKKQLVDKFYKLGLSVSYDKVMQVSTDMGNGVCALYEQEGVVCPPMLRKTVFTTGNVDNIDHDTSSRTAKSSFHGTAITLTQHPTADRSGTERNKVLLDPEAPKTKVLANLPESYTSVRPLTIGEKKDLFVPVAESGTSKPDTNLLDESIKHEHMWLNKVEELLDKEKEEERDYISWAAHFASLKVEVPRPPAITGLLPLFTENAHTAAMIQHSMKIIKEATNYVNPGQTPIIAMDQPLFALAKQIQWRDDVFGEDKFVVMMGGLHIEMAALKMIGKWLANSGWDAALVQADVTTPGRADAILKASHITRSRYAHQVSACALHILQKNAYDTYLNLPETDDPLGFKDWVRRQCDRHPQFHYWSLALELEILILELVRSIREGEFELYIQVLGKLVPWMFALDSTNYSRWLPVHIRDLLSIKTKHPRAFEEFIQGKFVVQKTKNVFSMIALDQNHEQENEAIKGDGGAVGLTENPVALRRWMVAGPEIARVVKEFERGYIEVSKNNKYLHHEQVPSVQKAFAKDVRSLTVEIKNMGNPFTEDSNDLVVLDTKDIMSERVVESVKTAKSMGDIQYATFVEERLKKCTTAITDTIKRNSLPLFGTSEKALSKVSTKISTLKGDCSLFSRLYIACQSRQGNLEDFFKHENRASPPSLANGDQLRSGQKSVLLECFEGGITTTPPHIEVVVIDAAATVNMLPPRTSKTFLQYANSVFIPHITNQASCVKRVDLVWDRYIENSLKSNTRINRGSGVRRRVSAVTTLPANWQSFLRCSKNKIELFNFLSSCVSSVQSDSIELISTYEDDVISSSAVPYQEMLTPCNHEEADTRILVHIKHAAACGYRRMTIRTVDTDVVVLAIANFTKLQIDELWIAFGVGKHLRYLPVHTIAVTLTLERCEALPFFHAVTGCDTVSFMSGRGKKTAWSAWNAMPELTTTLCHLSTPQNEVTLQDIRALERFVVILYSRTCPLTAVNEARQFLFTQGTRSIENIPPTQDALSQHVKRAAYQACQVWGQTLTPIQQVPSPSNWGWKKSENGSWSPIWSELPEAAKACSELIHCGCKKACRGLCKCTKANLACTALCYCAGNCFQE